MNCGIKVASGINCNCTRGSMNLIRGQDRGQANLWGNFDPGNEPSTQQRRVLQIMQIINGIIQCRPFKWSEIKTDLSSSTATVATKLQPRVRGSVPIKRRIIDAKTRTGQAR